MKIYSQFVLTIFSLLHTEKKASWKTARLTFAATVAIFSPMTYFAPLSCS